MEKLKKKTVLYIQGVTRYGGALESLYHLTSHLKRYRPLVVTSKEGELTKRLANIKVKYFTVEMGMWRKAKTWPTLAGVFYHLYRRSKKEKVRLIHCNTLWDTPYGVVLGRLLKVPVITHIRNTFDKDKIKKYMLDKVDLVITVSMAVAQPLKDTKIPFRIVYNGVNLKIFNKKTPKNKKIYQELGLKDAFIILLSGRIDTTKGQREAILAISNLAKIMPQTLLVIAGEASRQQSWLTEELKALVKTYGIERNVIFTGAVEGISSLYAACDLAIMPSLESAREGFGRVLIEAMATGKATVASKTGGIPEVVRDEITGFLIDPEDKDALTKAIQNLLTDPKRRAFMGENGYALVFDKFDLRKTCEKIEALYDEII